MESILKDRAALLALGGNEKSASGPPEATISVALTSLASDSIRLVRVSRFYRSAAFPPGSGPDYVNAAAMVETPLDATELLRRLHEIEADCGRVRTRRWGPRTLDLDLIAVADELHPDAETLRTWIDLPPAEQGHRAPDRLVLPHPRLQDRAFVLVPLEEIAPLWRHPLTGRTVAEMVAALPEAAKAEITPL
jgi:2-amino-4-hydroxy-6-hydroxymethyldihydropteridine diphosphokinase